MVMNKIIFVFTLSITVVRLFDNDVSLGGVLPLVADVVRFTLVYHMFSLEKNMAVCCDP